MAHGTGSLVLSVQSYPPGQDLHSAWPSIEIFPVPHDVAPVIVLQELPDGHWAHSACPDGLKYPLGHRTGFEDLSGQEKPAGQSMHAVLKPVEYFVSVHS